MITKQPSRSRSHESPLQFSGGFTHSIHGKIQKKRNNKSSKPRGRDTKIDAIAAKTEDKERNQSNLDDEWRSRIHRSESANEEVTYPLRSVPVLRFYRQHKNIDGRVDIYIETMLFS